MDPLSLPALAVLITLKGLPGFGIHRQAPVVLADSLPPAWRPVSRLALENDFVTSRLPDIVRERTGIRLSADPRTLRVSVDADSGTLSTGALVSSVPVGPPLRLTLDSYSGDLSRRNFERVWQRRSIEAINTRALSATPGSSGGGLSFKLPSPLPRRVQSLLGPGGPAINVAGSENIRLSGQSNWTNQQIGPLGQKRSLFPSLDMQQDLDIRLEGQLSDRIKVNLLQNSANQIPLANRIFINYRGDEDDLVQSLDLGNTSLSLPGTQYVSYSGKNEGLFGVKTALRLGPADFTMLASKQEGRSERASYAGGASREERSIPDLEYIKGIYFLLYDPNVLPAWVPSSVASHPRFFGIEIPDNTIRVFLDDGNYNNDLTDNARRGKALIDPDRRGCSPEDTTAVRGSYSELNPGANEDYELLRDVYGPFFKVIRLRRQVTGEQRLAVSYRARAVDVDGLPLTDLVPVGGDFEPDSVLCGAGADTAVALRLKILRPPVSAFSADAAGNFDPANPFTRVRDLELKNFYQLPGQRIDAATFKLAIRRGVDEPPLTSIARSDNSSLPYLELLGLDSQDEGSGRPLPGHDGLVDGSIPFANSRKLVDFENGILFFPDPRPFAPRISGPSAKPFESAVSRSLVRRDSLIAHRDSLTGANAEIYEKYIPRRDLDVRYYIDVEFSAARAVGEISLGRGNILEGSEVVTINGQALSRDRDYSIDYDIGRLTLKRQLGASDNLNVNYSYAPLFAQAGRTLIGGDFRLEGRDKRFGGALIYESRGAQDLRPRIGEEPSRSVIADLNTEWTFHPDWVTRLVDRLPGVRTTTPSDFHFQAEMGASFPNPNTKNVVYLDDMESVRDAVTLSMTAERWRNASVPTTIRSGLEVSMLDLPGHHAAEIAWYSPPSAIKERELNPELTDAQGGTNSRQVLALSVPRRPTVGALPSDSLWVALTYPLDAVGLDLSRAQFLEFWVNDFNDHHQGSNTRVDRIRGRNVKMHIDLGVVSENQMRAPNVPPNTSLDSEDRPPRDNQLSVSGGNNEDTGLDGRLNANEPGGASAPDLSTVTNEDPEGDDFHKVNEDIDNNIDTRRFFGTNGTEDNRNLLPYPDTEDLNLNSNLDTAENYFQYTVELGDSDSPYLRRGTGTDVLRDFPSRAGVDSLNGWRRYRIPLNDPLRQVFGSPDLTLARHVRIWLEGVITPNPTEAEANAGGSPIRPIFMLGGFDIVGSRWQTALLDSVSEVRGTTFTLNSVNNIDDRATYQPPFDPGDALSGNRSAQRREQSLSLEFSRLLPGSSVEAFKTFSLDENYSRYGKLSWYAKAFDLPNTGDPTLDSLSYFVRFASDEQGRSYYEFRRRLTNDNVGGFEAVELALTELSNLKLNGDFPLRDPIHYVVPGRKSGDSLIVHGRPSFTRLRRVSVGVINDAAVNVLGRGQLWFNELRAIDVAKDVGTAGRMQLDGKLANLVRYNVAYNQRGADFVTVGETRGSGNTTSLMGVNGGFDLHRFFEGTGINLPVNGSYSRNISRPRFTAGDDVIRPGALQAASETRNESRSVSTSYSRSWSDRSNPLLRYTLGGITAGTSYSESDGRSPTTLSSGSNVNSNVSYSVAPRNLLKLRIPGSKLGFFPLPERMFWNYTTARSQNQTLDRQRDGTILPRNSTTSRTAMIAFGADTRPIDLLHHRIDATRNLTLPTEQLERVGFINFGRVVQWRQSFDSRYTLNRGPWASPGFNWNSSYNQNNGPDLSKDLSVRAVSNGQTVGLNWALPFDRLAPPRRAATDSTRRRLSAGLLARDAASRLGNVSADASFSQASGYSRLTGTPNLLYLAGLHSAPGFNSGTDGVRARLGNTSSQSNDFRSAGRARLSMGYDAYISTRAEYTRRQSNNNDVVSRTVGTRFPDLDFEYGRIAQVARINKLLENPVLRTSYSRSVQTEYRGSESRPSSRSTSSQWQPLIGLSGMLRNQTRTELRIERRVSERENFQLNSSITTDRNTDVNLNMSRSYSKGQKVSLLGKEKTVRSNVNLSMALAYSKQSGETRQVGTGQTQLPVNRDRLSVNGTGSYSFSSNVTGNLGLGFGQNRDIERDIVSRNIRLELRAAFNF